MSEPFPRADGWLHAAAVPLARIAEKVGAPVYVYSAPALAERYDAAPALVAAAGVLGTACSVVVIPVLLWAVA